MKPFTRKALQKSKPEQVVNRSKFANMEVFNSHRAAGVQKSDAGVGIGILRELGDSWKSLGFEK